MRWDHKNINVKSLTDFYESDVIDMGFVGIKQKVPFPQQAMYFHEPNPSDCIFKKYVPVNPALWGCPDHDPHWAVDVLGV